MGGDRHKPDEYPRGTPLLSGVDFFKGWESGPRQVGAPPGGIENLLPERPASPFGTGIDLLKGWGKPGDRTVPTTPGDRPAERPVVRDGVIELNYADPEFDKKLAASQGATTLRITGMPADKQILTWADDRGYYFFFGKDDKVNHYFPASLKVIEANGNKFDMDRSRLQVSETYMAPFTGQQGGFETFGPRNNAMQYFWNMSKVSGEALAWQEKILRDAAQNSNNPYFRIYLADVLMMQAMQPLVNGVMGGGITAEHQGEIIKKLDEANKQLQEAERLSSGELAKRNNFPQRNVATPLSPGAFLYRPRPGEYYDHSFYFWGGAWDQALRREAFVKTARGFIASGAYKWFELPPDMSRR